MFFKASNVWEECQLYVPVDGGKVVTSIGGRA